MTNRFGLRNYDTWIERLIKLTLLVGAVSGFALSSGRMLANVVSLRDKLDRIVPIVEAHDVSINSTKAQIPEILRRLDDLKKDQREGFNRLENRIDRIQR